MKMKKILLSTTAALLIGTAGVSAQTVAEQVIAALQDQGYESIEVTTSPTQVKVEAIRDGRKLEAIYDAQTGEILKQEVENVDPDEDYTPGVSFDNEDDDFIDEDEDDDEDSDEDDDSADDDDSDDGGDDDHDDDDDDDDDSDDNGGDRDGDDDDQGEDRDD